MTDPNQVSRRRLIAGAGAIGFGMAGASASAEDTLPPPPKDYPDAIPVAILLGSMATLIDFAGPWEVLGAASYVSPGFNVYAVAETRKPIRCDDGRGEMGDHKPPSGPWVVPDYTFDNAPAPKIVIMGAQMDDDPRKIEWIRRVAKNAELVASVCVGARLLAKTGLLDGKSATTNPLIYNSFEKSFPRVKLVRGVRFVDEGTVATAAGLTAGIDLALHIVRRFYGPTVAQKVAQYEETPFNESAGVVISASDTIKN
jgi:transcriptional regulator GlxA family with amidase domain